MKLRTNRWVNTRVVLDMATGVVLERVGYEYDGPMALAEGETPEQKLAAAMTAIEAANKRADETTAELAKVRKTNADLSGKVLSDDDRKKFDDLVAKEANAEEDRKKKAGEFDALRSDLVKKHGEELGSRDKTIQTLSDRFKTTVKVSEFGRAAELFGGAESKTILDVDLALAALGSYVHIEDDDKSPLGYKVVVKKANGTPIVGKDGTPAPFAEAMVELINSLPNKDRILRGSGKTGSGSSGGSGGGSGTFDLAELTARANKGDVDALKQLKQHVSGLGGIVMGEGVKRTA